MLAPLRVLCYAADHLVLLWTTDYEASVRRVTMIVLLAAVLVADPEALRHAQPAHATADQPVDLTGKVAVIVTFRSRDNFSNEFRYEVTVRNIGPDPIVGDSMLLILDRVMNVGGEAREPLRNDPLLKRMEVLGADGETDEGKPFFLVDVDGNKDLLPQTESRPVTVRLRNLDYVQVFTPAFRVMGTRRLPPPAKKQDLLSSQGPAVPVGKQPIDKLIQLLIKKGILTEEEWRAATQPAP